MSDCPSFVTSKCNGREGLLEKLKEAFVGLPFVCVADCSLEVPPCGVGDGKYPKVPEATADGGGERCRSEVLR